MNDATPTPRPDPLSVLTPEQRATFDAALHGLELDLCDIISGLAARLAEAEAAVTQTECERDNAQEELRVAKARHARDAEAIATFIGHECEVYDEPDAGGTPAQERDMAGGQPLGLAGAPAGDGAARPEDVRPAPTGVPPLVGGEGEPAGAKPGDVAVNPSPSPARGGEGNG